MGVCLPSFGGFAGARRVRMKSAAWLRIVAMPLSAIYFLSAAESLNRDRNFDLESFANASSTPICHLAIACFSDDVPNYTIYSLKNLRQRMCRA